MFQNRSCNKLPSHWAVKTQLYTLKGAFFPGWEESFWELSL